MGEPARIMEALFEVWLAKHRKFLELATSVRTLGETIERQRRSLTYVLEALRGVSAAASRPLSRSSGVTPSRLSRYNVGPRKLCSYLRRYVDSDST